MPRQRLDYRSKGGYIVAVPSVIGGRPYEVLRGGPVEHSFDWQAAKTLLEPEAGRRPGRPAVQPGGPDDLTRLAGWVGRQPEGNRDQGLFWAACRALEDGHDDLDALAEAATRSGLTRREITATLDSARRTVSRSAAAGRRPFDREAAS